MEETTETNNESTTADSNAKEYAGRLRDEKGHFLPNPDKKPKRTRKPKDDANTVKIRIVKDEVPTPEKDYEGRLEDMKERTATNFIKSVCYHKPRAINIDGLRYYSQDFVEILKQKLADERLAGIRGLETLNKTMDALKKTSKTLEDCFDSAQKVRRSRFIWRCIAIASLATLISFCITTAIDKRNAARAIAKAPVVQTPEIGTQVIAK